MPKEVPELKSLPIGKSERMSPETLQKLEENGFDTVEAVSIATLNDLVECDIAEERAEEIIREAKKALRMAPTNFMTGKELMDKTKKLARLGTGIDSVDNVLGGGLKSGEMTLVWGEYGIGKTQLCHQLAVTTQLPIDQHGLAGGTLWMDTENTFSIPKVVAIAERFGMKPQETLNNIVVARVYNSDHQLLAIQRSVEQIKQHNIRTIIVDSLVAHFRSEYLGRDMLAPKQQKLAKFLRILFARCRQFNAVGVCTTQAVANPTPYQHRPFVMSGGFTVGHRPQTILFIRRGKGEGTRQIRIMQVEKAVDLEPAERIFEIKGDGLHEVIRTTTA